MSDSTSSAKKAKKAKNKGKRKAPGLMSFVVWRQFFMVLGAPGIATAAAATLSLEPNYFIPTLIGAAVPSLIHGQLWKWTYDWAGRGAGVMRNLRIGQIALGALHSALCGWALLQVAIGAVSFESAGFYYGLAIAALAGGVWETIRPAMELRDPPEVKEAAARKAARKKKKEAQKKADAMAAAESATGDEAVADADADTDAPTDAGADADEAPATDETETPTA